jgi:integrase
MAKPKRKSRCWSHTEGARGYTVTVYEREPGGVLYARTFDPKLGGGKGGYRRLSLGHTNRERAEVYAVDQAAKLRTSQSELQGGKSTMARLLAEYLANRTPRKSSGEQQEDRRRAQMWARYLGPQRDPHAITLGEWERFIDLRGCGQLGADGASVPEVQRRPVGARTVEADLKWLRWLLNWGTRWRDAAGKYALRENAVRGYDLPAEKNPARPLASDDRFDSLRAASEQVEMELRLGGKRTRQRSYLSELLDLLHDTGRRIRPICELRYEDLRLEPSPKAPFGAIQWPGQTDKEGKAWSAPITPRARAALDRVLKERPGIVGAYLFPCPTDPSRPVQYERVRTWLLAAERLAGLRKQHGSTFHAFRRAWATARKHLPTPDVAAAGGWNSTVTLDRCYQQPDEGTMLSVVLGGYELREKKA